MTTLCLPARNASEWTGPTGNNTYLFLGPPSVLIDAGVGSGAHVEAIARALAGRSLDLVLLTHSHTDHAAGVPALIALWPRVTIRGGPGEALRDGETFHPEGTQLSAIHTPGHAPDHFCFLDTATRDLYCGDLARNGGTVVIPASRGGDLGAYLNSLRRVRALDPVRMLPAHGAVIDDPRRLIDDYLAHREERTTQIRQALADGLTSPEAIVSRIYPGLSPTLRDAATDTVVSHMENIRRRRG